MRDKLVVEEEKVLALSGVESGVVHVVDQEVGELVPQGERVIGFDFIDLLGQLWVLGQVLVEDGRRLCFRCHFFG